MQPSSTLSGIRHDLTAAREALRAAFDAVPESRRQDAPGDGGWSAAGVIEHLAVIEEKAAATLRPLVEGAPPAPAGQTATPLDAARITDRSDGRRAAPEFSHPTGVVDATLAWAALERTRRSLETVLDLAEGKDLTAIGRDHPVLGRIDGYQWLALLGAHERRHVGQLRGLSDALRATEPQ